MEERGNSKERNGWSQLGSWRKDQAWTLMMGVRIMRKDKEEGAAEGAKEEGGWWRGEIIVNRERSSKNGKR